MQQKTVTLLMVIITALLVSAGCTGQTAPQQALAPTSPAQPVISTITPPAIISTTAPPEITTVLPAAPMTPIQINDIISLDNMLYYVYAEDSSVYYLKAVEENASGDGYVFTGPATAPGIKQPLDYVNTNARYLDHVDPYGSDAVRSKTDAG